MPDVDHTHDPALVSWIQSANDEASAFPLQNLPWCAFHRQDEDETCARSGVRLGEALVDVEVLAEAHFFDDIIDEAPEPGEDPALLLGGLPAWTPKLRSAVRARLVELFREDCPLVRDNAALRRACLIPVEEAQLLLPLGPVGDYTDFYASIHHATNVGSMFRPDNPLLPNYKWVPIGYHGRASSIGPTGQRVRRPCGQRKADDEAAPAFGPSRLLDYELEVGCFVAQANGLGEPVAIEQAEEHILGLCLVNDWSARDLQKWEYQPLGPFLAKSFATTISPYVVTLEALAPFRCPAFERPEGDPQPLAYLDSERNRASGGFAITVEALLQSERMRAEGVEPMLVSSGSFADMYWTFAQMLAHHTSNGCNLQPGDLLASGTVSGPAEESRGCLLERTWRGQRPLTLPTGEQRRFLEDGDRVILRARCEREGFRTIGFGLCEGVVLPAREL